MDYVVYYQHDRLVGAVGDAESTAAAWILPEHVTHPHPARHPSFCRNGDYDFKKYSMLNMRWMKTKDKSKHLSKEQRRKLQKLNFCWTDDEIQLLLESVNHYQCECEY